MRILVFGDSITQGFYDVEGGWVARLGKYFDQQRNDNEDIDPPTVFNLGVSGDTSHDLLNRIENEIKARQWPGEELVVVINIGVNDSRIDGTQPFSSIATFEENITHIVHLSQKYASKVVIIGLTPCVESRTNPVSWNNPPISWTNERLSSFNQSLRKIALDQKLSFIDIYDTFLSKNSKSDMLPDGLHPSPDGHKLLYELIRERLNEVISP